MYDKTYLSLFYRNTKICENADPQSLTVVTIL